jgi:hypothetical protein
MQFPNPIVNQLVIYGSGDNLPDVTIGPSPLITFYNGTDIVIRIGIFDASTAPRMQIQNSLGHVLELGLHPSSQIPRLEYTVPSGTTADIWLRRRQISPSRDALELRFFPLVGSAILFALQQNLTTNANEVVTDTFISTTDRTIGATDTEIWHTAVPINGWTGTAEYKILPTGEVIWRGSLGGGTNVVGTQLINAPASPYWPAVICRFVTATGSTGAPGAVQFSAAGALVIAALPSIASVWFDSIRYSTI